MGTNNEGPRLRPEVILLQLVGSACADAVLVLAALASLRDAARNQNPPMQTAIQLYTRLHDHVMEIVDAADHAAAAIGAEERGTMVKGVTAMVAIQRSR